MYFSTAWAFLAMLFGPVLSAVAFPPLKPEQIQKRGQCCKDDHVIKALYDNSVDASAFCSCFVGGSTLYNTVYAATVTTTVVVTTLTPVVTVFGGQAT